MTYKCTIVNSEGEQVVEYVRLKIQADAYKATGFDVEEVDEIETAPVNKGGRPRKTEE